MPPVERVVRVRYKVDADRVVARAAREVPRPVGELGVVLPRIAAAATGVLHVLEELAFLRVKLVDRRGVRPVAVEEVEPGAAV